MKIIIITSLEILFLSLVCCESLNSTLELTINGQLKSKVGWVMRKRIHETAFGVVNPNTAKFYKDVRKQSHRLRIQPLEDNLYGALVISQFINITKIVEDHCQALPSPTSCRSQFLHQNLLFSIYGNGTDLRKVLVYLDIQYDVIKYYKVQFHLNSSHTSGFTRSTYLIQTFGELSTAMLHITLDQTTNNAIDLTNISLLLQPPMEHQIWPVYAESFPPQRVVIPFFLRSGMRYKPWSITLASQMTIDRLELLKESARHWRGPMSISLLVTNEDTKEADVLEFLANEYYHCSELYKYVNIHIVLDDKVNDLDTILYPINFLRNLAISQVQSEYVMLLDIDTIPGFTELEARKWIADAKLNSTEKNFCEKCAFVVPFFEVTAKYIDLPRSKSALQSLLKQTPPLVHPYKGYSQSSVDVPRWLKSDKTYKMKRIPDMEVFLIVPSKAPILSELFIGYGRDRSSYINNLCSGGYCLFYVLPDAFLLNFNNFVLFSDYQYSNLKMRTLKERTTRIGHPVRCSLWPMLSELYHSELLRKKHVEYADQFLYHYGIPFPSNRLSDDVVMTTNVTSSVIAKSNRKYDDLVQMSNRLAYHYSRHKPKGSVMKDKEPVEITTSDVPTTSAWRYVALPVLFLVIWKKLRQFILTIRIQ